MVYLRTVDIPKRDTEPGPHDGGVHGAFADNRGIVLLISPTEPAQLKALGKVSGVPERFGVDVLILAGGVRTGVQRKKFPDDLMSSLADGRLYSQLPKMMELDRSVLIFEGAGKWTMDGELIHQYTRNFTRGQFLALQYSIIWEFGVHVIHVKDLRETCEALKVLEGWAGKKKHSSLRTRPGAPKDSWGRIGERQQAQHLLQGLPGIGVEMAGRIYDHFGRVPLKWDCTVADLMSVKGVGKVKAEKIWKALGET